MATKTLYLTNSTDTWQLLSETSPGADTYASPVIGWKVGKTAILNYAAFDTATESNAFGLTPIYPDGSLDATIGDAFRAGPYDGSFASANWTFNFVVRANSNATGQDGRIGMRIFKSTNADGSSATEITTLRQTGANVVDLLTSASQNSSITYNPGVISLSNEYLFFQIGWEIQGSATNVNADVNFYIGDTGTRIVTSDFSSNYTLKSLGLTGVG